MQYVIVEQDIIQNHFRFITYKNAKWFNSFFSL